MTKPRATSLVRVSPPKSAINVTPLVDVVLVLLIIFMVVMPLLEKEIALRIPDTSEVETPSEVPDAQLVVRVESDGTFTIDGERTAPERYVEALRARLTGRAPGQRVVFVGAASEAPYPRLVEALEGAQQAGAATLAMAPPEEAAAPR